MLEYDRGPPACTNAHKEINVRIIETRCSRPFIFFFSFLSPSFWLLNPFEHPEARQKRTNGARVSTDTVLIGVRILIATQEKALLLQTFKSF